MGGNLFTGWVVVSVSVLDSIWFFLPRMSPSDDKSFLLLSILHMLHTY